MHPHLKLLCFFFLNFSYFLRYHVDWFDDQSEKMRFSIIVINVAHCHFSGLIHASHSFFVRYKTASYIFSSNISKKEKMSKMIHNQNVSLYLRLIIKTLATDCYFYSDDSATSLFGNGWNFFFDIFTVVKFILRDEILFAPVMNILVIYGQIVPLFRWEGKFDYATVWSDLVIIGHYMNWQLFFIFLSEKGRQMFLIFTPISYVSW